LATGDSSVHESARLLGVLADLDRRLQSQALGLPQQEDEIEQWEGVVFDVGDSRMVVRLDEVHEILNYPSNVSLVPGAKPWVRGVANIRGNLLPIADLQAFLGGPLTPTGRRSRVLVTNQGDALIGLLVGQTVATRHFDETNRAPKQDLAGGAGAYVIFGFKQDDAYWPVFSIKRLLQSEGFQSAAR
jgi:twitching motility protein PilI